MRPAHETAQLRLARLHVDTATAREQLLEETGRVSARTLGVGRVSLWFLSDDRRHLHCAMVVLRATGGRGRWDGVPVLSIDKYPSYFQAIEERRVVVARDARTHPATRELTRPYLEPLGIRSLLDAPLYMGGVVTGVVCHEATDAERDWSQEDVDFATSVADLASASLAQLEWRDCQQLLTSRTVRLREDERLATLTRVVKAFIHDFNNVLNVVALSAAALHRQAPAADDVATGLEEGTSMATRLVDQLRSFVDRDTSSEVATPVGEIIASLQPVLDMLVRDRVALTVDVEPSIASRAVPRTPVEQVLVNLCLNARDATEGYGTVVLRARPARADEGGGDRVALVVEDRGVGMTPEIIARAFEPYFTTKETGTGLGLATSREMVEEMGGQIHVESEPGRGSVFTVVLPCRAAPTP